MGKETTTEKYIKKAVNEAKKEFSGSTSMTNCNITGSTINFDESVMGAISDIAEGCIENAKTLGKLAEVLKASNIKIEPLVKIGN